MNLWHHWICMVTSTLTTDLYLLIPSNAPVNFMVTCPENDLCSWKSQPFEDVVTDYQ